MVLKAVYQRLWSCKTDKHINSLVLQSALWHKFLTKWIPAQMLKNLVRSNFSNPIDLSTSRSPFQCLWFWDTVLNHNYKTFPVREHPIFSKLYELCSSHWCKVNSSYPHILLFFIFVCFLYNQMWQYCVVLLYVSSLK